MDTENIDGIRARQKKLAKKLEEQTKARREHKPPGPETVLKIRQEDLARFTAMHKKAVAAKQQTVQRFDEEIDRIKKEIHRIEKEIGVSKVRPATAKTIDKAVKTTNTKAKKKKAKSMPKAK